MNGSQHAGGKFEALFRQAVIDNFYEGLDTLPPDDVLAEMHTFSPGHEARMKRLFAKERWKDRLRATAKWGKRAAAVLTIVLSISFGSLMLVPEVRAAVVSTVIEWFDEFVRFASGTPAEGHTGSEPRYVPDGFTEEARSELELVLVVIFANDEGSTIVFESGLAGGLLSVDKEGVVYETYAANGVDYHLFAAVETGGENTIVWESDGQRYLLRSTISAQELRKMAESVTE